jgi:hypothetical protein
MMMKGQHQHQQQFAEGAGLFLDLVAKADLEILRHDEFGQSRLHVGHGLAERHFDFCIHAGDALLILAVDLGGTGVAVDDHDVLGR